MAPSSRFRAGDGRARGRTEPGRTYQVPKGTVAGARMRLPMPHRYAEQMRAAIARTLVMVAMTIGVAGCAGGGATFDPTGACVVDGAIPGAYPELEARLPTEYRGERPEVVDSGRNCSDEALGTLAGAFEEIRFAGGTWTFGAERALVLAVFTAPGLDAEAMRDFYTASARNTTRMEILGESEIEIAGREAYRLDAKRVERLQTVVVWPSGDEDHVNVVITNDLPDARIQEAIEAFGDR
jgi:hypothetical protein